MKTFCQFQEVYDSYDSHTRSTQEMFCTNNQIKRRNCPYAKCKKAEDGCPGYLEVTQDDQRN